MIPKIVHYCWFGNNSKTKEIIECIESWRKYLPNYIFMEWNETNFNINHNKYVQNMFQEKEWAFLSDYVRLYALHKHGGVYLDTDMELKKDLSGLLTHKNFIAFEDENTVSAGIIGAEKNSSFIKEILEIYEDGSITPNKVPIPQIITKILTNNYNLNCNNQKQELNNGMLTVYESYNFYVEKLGEINYSVHHYNGSWIPYQTLRKEYLKFKKNYMLLTHILNTPNIELLEKRINKYNNIALYGNGYLTRALLDRCVESLKITAIIENGSNQKKYKDIPVINLLDSRDVLIDLVIVTPTYEFNDIKKELQKYKNWDVASLEDILDHYILY